MFLIKVQRHHLHQWAPLQVADLIYRTGISFFGVDFHCSRTMSISSKHLGPPWQVPSINLYITCGSDFINIMLNMVIPFKPSLKMRSSSLSSSFASSSLDLMFLWLDIANLFDRGPVIVLQAWSTVRFTGITSTGGRM